VPDGAGRIRRETGAPLCKPTPLQSTAERIVCSWVKKESGNVPVNPLDYAHVNKTVCGKTATVRGAAGNHAKLVDLQG
jgi:hypothetical protein